MPVEKKKICLIAPSLQMGGIERAMSTLANYFVSQGHEVHFITLFPFEPFFVLDERINVYTPPYLFPRYGRSLLQTISYYAKMLAPFWGHIYRVVKRVSPDVILSFGDVFPHMAMLQLSYLKIPFYYSNRSNPNIKYNLLITTIRNVAYKFSPPTGVIAQTKEAMLRKKKILGDEVPIVIIPNPVRQIEIKSDIVKENYIVSVGRLHKEKGFIRLMKVFSELNAPDWKLVLVGGGQHELEIKQMAVDLGIVDRVIFTGKTKDVDIWLQKSEIFVLASHNEGYPNALCEAMAAGLACVAFDIVAGPKDIISNGDNGFLVPDNDLKAMADKLQLLISNVELRDKFSLNALQICESNSIEVVGNMFLDFIIQKR